MPVNGLQYSKLNIKLYCSFSCTFFVCEKWGTVAIQPKFKLTISNISLAVDSYFPTFQKEPYISFIFKKELKNYDFRPSVKLSSISKT